MASMTSWTRLEPDARAGDMRGGLQARVHDPLWLLARQWQLGEFSGEDAGSPIMVELRSRQAPLSRYHLGAPDPASPTGLPYDGRKIPLEALVEREPVIVPESPRPHWRQAVEIGLQFQRMLEEAGQGGYRPAYLARYALQMPGAEQVGRLDAQSLRFLKLMVGRVPDGLRLYRDLRAALSGAGGTAVGLPALPVIEPTDQAAVRTVALAWLAWLEGLFSQPDGAFEAWNPERMEYRLAVSGNLGDEEVVLEAPEYAGGHLDWYSFDWVPGASLGSSPAASPPTVVTSTAIPMPVTYRGMPADRWWEFEDSQVNFGAVEAGPEDLLRLLFVEFALVYGNDWFVAPVELEVGSLFRMLSLVVTDTFGQRFLVKPYQQVDGAGQDWRWFSLASGRKDSQALDEFSFLPPVLGPSMQGPVLEEVLFLRDELANMAWAVERVIESPIGKPLSRVEAYPVSGEGKAGEGVGQVPQAPDAPLRYRLASEVPSYWFPLVPVRIDPVQPDIRLQRGTLLHRDDGDGELRRPQGRILEPGRPLSLFEEEVPRAGARIARAFQHARWLGGSSHLWIGRRKGAGRGEGSSGLRYDILEHPE